MTIVLSKGETADDMKKALFEGATVAWSYDDLLGREENIRMLVESCLSLEPRGYERNSTVLKVGLRNDCPVNFTLRNFSEETFQNFSDTIRVERHSTLPLTVRMKTGATSLALNLEVLNAQVGFRKTPFVTLATAVSP